MPIIQMTSPTKTESGFTLIEVLVAAIILAIGILGVASLMLSGVRSDKGAYLRTQASIIAYDMADRIRANRTAANNGNYNNIDTNGTLPVNPNCTTCSPAQIAALDIFEWTSHFKNVSGLARYRAKLPNGRGVVTGNGNTFTIAITWSEIDWDAANNNQRDVEQENLTINFEL